MLAEVWTDVDDDQLRALRADGMSWDEISGATGRTVGSLRGRWQRIKDVPPDVTRQQHSASKTHQAREEIAQAVAEIRQAVQSRVIVTPQYEMPVRDIEKEWLAAEEENEQHIERATKGSEFVAEFPTDRVSAVTFSADKHIALKAPVSLRRIRIDGEVMADTPDLHVVEVGDAVDNHIKHRAAVLSSESKPQTQYEFFDHYLALIKHRILCMVTGNHEYWTKQIAGIDVVQWLADKHRICYAPHEARLTCRVGTQTYRIGVRHQYRLSSSFNQTHSVKQWVRLGASDFDIAVIGHHHEHAYEEWVYRDKLCHVARPGSYQVSSAYSAQMGYNLAIPTCPTFLLFPAERKITYVSNIHDVPRQLQMYNG